MGEVAATTAAFDQEFTKALTNILARKRAPPPEPVKKSKGERDDQVERASVWQQLEKLGDLMALYFHRLPAFVGVPRMIDKAIELQRKREFKHAWTKGFAVIENLGLLDPEKNFPQMTESQRREFEVQARFGSCMCELGLLKGLDGALRHPHTVGSMLRLLGNLRQAMQIVLPDERLYWLVYNGSVNIGTVALPLVQAGFAAEVVEFLLFAVVALESVLVLCAPRFLPWRLSLVAVVCQCYVDLQVPDHARSFVIRQQQKLKDLQKLETLEPIPLTPEIARIYQEAENKLSVLLFRTSHADLATPEAAVQLLQKELDAPGDHVRAVLEALRDPARRTMRRSPPPETQQKLLNALDAVAWPLLGIFVQAEVNNAKLAALEAAALKRREREEAVARGEAVEEEEAPPTPVEARPVSAKGKKGGKKEAPAAGKAAAPPEEQESQEATPKDLTQDVERACQAIPMELHMMVLSCVFSYDAHEMYTKILEASKARLRLAQHLDPPNQVELMSGLIDIFEAAKKVEQTADSANLRNFVDVLAAQREEVAYAAFPDVITDAALMLWGLVKTLMSELFQPKPDPVPLDPHDRELVTHLLLQLHIIFTKLDLDDSMLRGVLALRLVLLLEEGARLEEAAAVAAQALQAVHHFRAHLSERSRGAPDEARRWISATKPLDEVETGVGESEMAYSAIHADLYSLYVRTELKLGIQEQEAQAQRRKHRAISTMEKRNQQVDIFGTKTPGEAKTLERNIVDAERTPPNAVEKERLLLKAADKNCYEKALLLMQMAAFQPELMKRQHLLQEAAALLLYAESMEASFLRDVDATPQETVKGPKLPPKPRILTRTSTSLTVTNATDHIPGFRKRGVKPVAFAVYAKPFGSGVGASLHSTEYEGSGHAAPLGARVEIRGLQRNETYILAVTMLDEHGDIINGLGQPTQEIPALLPLPILLCWAYLAVTALRLGCLQVARRAVQAVLHHFTVTKVAAPLWNMNPFDSLVLNMTHVVAAPFPVLRALVQTLWAGAELAAATVEPIPHASKSYIHSQVSRLKMAKMIALAMEVSVFLKDEGLLNECVLRLYNAVGPLLTGTTRSARLAKVLASGYSAMTFLRSMRDERAVAASASIIYELVQLYRGVHEPKAAAFFSALDLPLLQAPPDKPPSEDPPHSPAGVGGDAPTVEKEPWNEDVLRLQEYLMSFPEVEDFGSKVLQARFADAADLPARVLHALLKEGAGAAYDLIKDHEIFKAPTIELKEIVMTFESADAAAGKAKGGKDGKGGKKPKPKTPPKGGATKTGDARAASTETPEATQLSEPRNPEVIQAVPCEDGYELHLQQLVRVCKEAMKRGEAAQVKEWITSSLDALKERLKCIPPQVGNDPSSQRPPSSAPGSNPAVSGKSELPSGGEQEQEPEEEELPELPEGEGEGMSREEVRLRAAELRRQTLAARTLQRYLPVMLAWRKHRLETRRMRESTFLYRSQLLQMRATVEFEERRAALEGGEHPLGAAAVVAATGVAPLLEEQDLDPDAPPPTPASLPVIRQLAQAVCLAARGGAVQQPGSWVQMLSAAKFLWNVVRHLLHRYPALGVFFGAPMCTAAAAMNNLIRRFRNDGLWLGPMKLARGASYLGLGEQVCENARVERPPSRDSEVSFGSDLQVDSWFAKFSSWFDMEWVHKVVHLTMLIGSVCDLPYAALNVGSDFNDLTDGRFAESLSPLLLICARKSGMHVPRFQALRDQTLRDLTTFMEALMLARQTWKKKQKKALVVDRDGKAISTASLGSKKGSQADGRSRGSMHGTQRGGGVLSAEEKSQAALHQAETAYNKAMEVLTYRGEKDLLSQAQNELGDLYAEHGDWHKAAILWNDCVDGITGVYKCIKTCAQFGLPSPPEMLATFGRTKCLMAGVVFAKLSKYSYPDDLSVRLNSALASAGMLSAVFACSYTHPQRGLEMAEYVPLEVWEGVNIFSDPFQCNVSDLSSSLHYVATVLLENHRGYLALPVLALLEHCAYHVTRDARATIACRLLRARAQCQVGLLPAAARTMVGVMQGQRLPGISNSNERTLLEPGQLPQVTAVPQYRSAELPGSENNQAVVKYLVAATLPEQLAQLYGEALRVRLKLCVADFLVALAEVPNCWVETDRVSGEKLPTKSAMGQFEAICLDHARGILVQVKEVVDPPPPEAATAEAGETPALPPRTLAAGDVALLVHAHLQLGRVEQLAYQYSAGLTHIKSALRLLEGRGKVKASQVASVHSAEGESAALGSLMWLKARAQQLEVLQNMKHHHLFKVVYAKATKEASEVHEEWLVIHMLLLNAMVEADDGRTQEAVQQLHNLARKCETVGGQVHSAKGILQATILAMLAELKRRCSQWEEAETLLNEARGLLEEVVEMHALKEMMEEPKLQSIYVQGVPQLAKVLVLIAELRLVSRDPFTSYTLLRQAHHLTGFMRSTPQFHARLFLLLARSLRLQPREFLSTQPLRYKAKGIDKALVAPESALVKCLSVCALDGAHDWDVLHEALMEQAALAVEAVVAPTHDAQGGEFAKEHAAALCTAYLHDASRCATMRCVIFQTPHALSASITDAALGNMPPWLKAAVLESEQFQESQRGVSPGGNLPQGRLLVELFASMAKMQNRRLMHADHIHAQVSKAHTYMKEVCAAYLKECCFEGVPGIFPAPDLAVAPAPLVPGTVLIQWQELEDVQLSQLHRHTKGANKPLNAALVLPRADCTVVAIFVVVAEPGAVLGGTQAGPSVVCSTRSMSLHDVHAAQAAVKAMSLKMEASEVATPLFPALPVKAPTKKEKEEVVDGVGRLFGTKEDGVVPPVLHTEVAHAVPKTSDKGSKPSTPMSVDADSGYTNHFMIQLESLLNTSDGVHLKDVSLANWLIQYMK